MQKHHTYTVSLNMQNYRTYTLEEYQRLGAKRFKEAFGEEMPSERDVEREFWHTVSTAQKFSVQYANDVEGTGVSL